MQINLAEVAFADVAHALPKVGMLYFFFHWHSEDEPDALDAGFVLFHKKRDQRLRRIKPPADMHSGGHFRGIELLPRLEWTVPDCDETNYQLGLWDHLRERVAEAQGLEATWGPTPVYRMLGHPELLQGCGLSKEERLLLQVSSDCQAGITEVGPYPETGMRWGDHGRIYYTISEADLKSQNFANVWAQMEDQ
jgi:hypothetical protein